MQDSLLKTVKDFLTAHYNKGPLLVGFSGGPDSMALLHLLLEFKLELKVAHVDHGWREESREEADRLERHVQSLKLPFYRRRLDGVAQKEDPAREARFAFFQELYRELGCQALVLGHHADDQSETVLKRVLEGASLPALGGIRPLSVKDGMTLWRPLLTVDKPAIREWLEKRGLFSVEDRTNLDSRFLRGRMRTAIIPELEKQFGKGVADNLCRLGETAQELSDYLDRKVRRYEDLMVEDASEWRVDLSGCYPLEPLEIKAFLKKWSEKNKIFLSHPALQTLYEILEKGDLHRKVGGSGRWIEVRGRSVAIKKL